MGSLVALIGQSFPPKQKFSVGRDIPDLTGKVMVVTGANTGVGKETVKALLSHNTKVYLAARGHAKAEQAIEDLHTSTGKRAIFLHLDLSSFKFIKRATEEFMSKETELHVLFNNAGVMHSPIDQLAADEYDLQFNTNCIGPFYFIKLLLPVLLVTTKHTADGKVRVVNTSSSTHMFHNLDFATFKDGAARKKLGSQLLYCQRKFGVVVVATELARRYGAQGLVSTSLNPGNLKTDLQRHLGGVQASLTNMILHDVSYGALTQLYAGSSPDGADMNGKYLIACARVERHVQIRRTRRSAETSGTGWKNK